MATLMNMVTQEFMIHFHITEGKCLNWSAMLNWSQVRMQKKLLYQNVQPFN